MWVKIAKDTFQKSDFKALNYLYQILSWCPSNMEYPRYNILIDTEEVEKTDNFKKLSSIEISLKDFLDYEFSCYVTESQTTTIPSYEVTYRNGLSFFNIKEAIIFFNQPVSIVLENNKNDSVFIEAIFEHLGNVDGKNKLIYHLSNGWIKFENAGGCLNIPNFMAGFLNQFKTLADENYSKKRKTSDYFRGIIIIDSDSDFPSQESKHTKLYEKLNDLGIFSHQIHTLEKRAMENYLPDEVYTEIKRQSQIEHPSLIEWIDTYLHLTPPQKDYLNIADGFPPKSDKYTNNVRKEVNQQILNFYSLSLSDNNFRKIDCGFNFKGFDRNGKLKTEKSSFKDEFPLLFKKNVVNKKNLQSRDGSGELQKIVDKISILL